MAAVLNYFKDSLDDFVLLAQHTPVQAALLAILIGTLAFTKAGANCIIRLQQVVLPNIIAIDDAEQRDDKGLQKSRNSSSVSQASRYDPENYIPLPIRGPARVSSDLGSSSASNVSTVGRSRSTSSSIRIPPWVHSPSPSDSPTFHLGWGFDRQPEGRRSVSWYPSTSPSHRGKFVLPSSSLISWKIHTSQNVSD